MSTPRNRHQCIARPGRRTLGFTLVSLALALSACASSPSRDSAAPSASDRSIATDFAGAIAQIDILDPSRTTLQMSEAARTGDAFGAAFLEALQRAGYAVRIATPRPDDRVVAFSVTDTRRSAEGRTLVYEVSVGDVSLRRRYLPVGADRVRPAATMLVKGADATAIRLDEALFDGAATPPPADGPRAGAASPSGASESRIATTIPDAPPDATTPTTPTTPTAPTAASGSAGSKPTAPAARPLATRPSESLVTIAAPTVTRSLAPEKPSLDALAGLTRDDKRNVRDLDGSNFAGFFDDYGLVRESVLVFGDDSLRLGKENKWRLQGIVDEFDPERDVFSVIGCSNGSTGYAGGNAGLALDRAARVTEALVYAGVPKDRILEEGCWAGEALTRMPNRGVVVALKRRTS